MNWWGKIRFEVEHHTRPIRRRLVARRLWPLPRTVRSLPLTSGDFAQLRRLYRDGGAVFEFELDARTAGFASPDQRLRYCARLLRLLEAGVPPDAALQQARRVTSFNAAMRWATGRLASAQDAAQGPDPVRHSQGAAAANPPL